ncbi:MAG TPA: glycosyltransferase family 2 protein [Smithellaceae bacterium]|nr:glycosyltransferase family 2 protein [Smithellaceae bacterium]HPL65689.1 glycosyltransferase family 2 protein [Smithellaceae bacterium]
MASSVNSNQPLPYPRRLSGMKVESQWPKISIVTPSLNQGEFIEEAIRSVLGQGYPCLEYVIIDGNSSDGSVDIIRTYEQQLTYWVSEPDHGQYDAINKGFDKTSGDIMAWLNSDDKYTPWAFSVVADIFSIFPQVEWLTTACDLMWDQRGRAVKWGTRGGFNRRAFFKGSNLPKQGWHATGWIQQESTFWRRSLWERAGSRIDASFKLAGDFDLWARFFHHTDLYTVSSPLGGFRAHGDQKSTRHMESYIEEAKASLRHYGGQPYPRWESTLRRLLYVTVMGDREMSRHRLPLWVSAILGRFHFFYPVKLCIWTNEGWQIDEGFIV